VVQTSVLVLCDNHLFAAWLRCVCNTYQTKTVIVTERWIVVLSGFLLRGMPKGETHPEFPPAGRRFPQKTALPLSIACSAGKTHSAAEQLLQKGLDDIRKKHGRKALTLQKTQNLFG